MFQEIGTNSLLEGSKHDFQEAYRFLCQLFGFEACVCHLTD